MRLPLKRTWFSWQARPGRLLEVSGQEDKSSVSERTGLGYVQEVTSVLGFSKATEIAINDGRRTRFLLPIFEVIKLAKGRVTMIAYTHSRVIL